MKTELLPQQDLAAFQDASSKVITPRVKGALSRIWCSQPKKPKKAAYQGAVYKDDGDMLGSVDFDLAVALFEAALAQGTALRLLQLDGTRVKKEFVWKARALAEHEHQALRSALAQAHERVVAAMQQAKTQHRTPVQVYLGSSSVELRGMIKRFGAWKPGEDLPVSAALAKAVAELRAGYEKRGFAVSGSLDLVGDKLQDTLALEFLPVEDGEEDAAPDAGEPAPSRDAEWGKPASKHKVVAAWLACRELLRRHMPDLYQNLAGPASSEKIAALERALGKKLPESVTALLACNDGQQAEQPGVFFGLRFLSCREIEAVWREWAKVRASLGKDDGDLVGRALTPGVRPDYSRAGWIPLFADGGRADYFGADMDPATGGQAGQVINFGRNEDDKYVATANLEGFLASLLVWCQQSTRSEGAPGWVAEVEGNDCVLFNHFHRLAEKPAQGG